MWYIDGKNSKAHTADKRQCLSTYYIIPCQATIIQGYHKKERTLISILVPISVVYIERLP